jgi:hypothetical protein
MPRSETIGSIYCDGDLVSAGNWGGVQISYLLNQANVDPTATDLEFHAADGYKISIQVEAAIQQNMIVAYEIGRPSLKRSLALGSSGLPRQLLDKHDYRNNSNQVYRLQHRNKLLSNARIRVYPTYTFAKSDSNTQIYPNSNSIPDSTTDSID